LSGLFFVFLFSFCVSVAQVSVAQTTAPAKVEQAVTSTGSPELQEFQKIEDSWSGAVNKRDQYSLELVLSPLFVDVASNGDITTRNQQVAQLIGGEDKMEHMEQRVVTVRMLGDIAVANGTYTLHHKAGSAMVDEKGVFTHVYERLRGGWVCINSQRTLLREDTPGKRKQASDTGFHIPLFGKKEPQ
jgi:hypothetical protein